MDKFNKAMVFAILFLSATIGWEGYLAIAGPAPGRSSIITPGTGAPCDIRIYIDSGQYGAANCHSGDNYGFNAVPDFGATINILATPNCPATGCLIYVEPGIYTMTTVINTLAGGQVLEGASREGVIIATPSPAGVATGKDWILNKNPVSGDKGIILRDFTFKGGTPTFSGNSYVNWDNAFHFQGAYESLIYDLHLTNAGGRMDFFSGATATQKQTYAGLNYLNVWDNVIADGQVGSSAFFSCNDCTVAKSAWLNCGDDCFLVAGWGKNVLFDTDVFDGSNNPNPTVGSSVAELYASNDGSVVASSNTTAIDIGIWHSHFVNQKVFTGNRAGIAGNAGTTIRIYGVIVEKEPGVTGALTNNGGGIISLGVLKIYNSISRLNTGAGITLTPATTGTIEDTVLIGNKLYDNGKGGSVVAGLYIDTGGSAIAQYVRIYQNDFYDDQGSQTQTTGINVLGPPTTPSAKLIAIANNFAGQPSTIFNGGAGNATEWKFIRDNISYNPIGKITNSFGTFSLSPFGTTSAVVASRDYVVYGSDMTITSTAGTGVNIVVKDNLGNTVWTPGATASGVSVPIGWKINFGAFSVAPTVTVYGN